MGSRHERTLRQVFEEPTPANLLWSDIEKMFRYFDGHLEERAGSRVAVELNGRFSVFHRPHPQKEAKRHLVRAVRDFCIEAGLTPEGNA